eukprot:322118-Pelagomonas_calceolata.AAC.4
MRCAKQGASQWQVEQLIHGCCTTQAWSSYMRRMKYSSLHCDRLSDEAMVAMGERRSGPTYWLSTP